MPEALSRRITDIVKRSPALNAPSSQSASPRRSESAPSRARRRSWTKGQALLVPALGALHQHGYSKIDDRRLDRAERGKHPRDRARSGVGIVGQQAAMTFGNMEHDRPGFEQRQIAFLVGRNLPERMQRAMGILLHLPRTR